MSARVAVTGGAGRLGRYVVDALAVEHDVVVLDRVADERAPHGPVDVLDLDAVRASLAGVDAVVHLAALDASVNATPEDFYRVNALGTWHVLQAAEERGIERVVPCSSQSAYGLGHASRALAPEYLPIDEAHPLRPSDAYGASKQAGEMAGRAFARRGRMSVIALRPAFVAFPDLVARMRGERAERAAGDPRVGPDGAWRERLTLLRTWVAPEDVAHCARAVLDASIDGFDVFNVAARDTFMDDPTLPYVCSLWDPAPAIRDPDRFEREPRASVLDCTRAAEILGWRPCLDWPAFVSERG